MSSSIGRDQDTYPLLVGGNYPANGGFIDNVLTWGTLRGEFVYYDKFDVCYATWNNSTGLPDNERVCRFDPLFLDNSGSLFDAVSKPGTIGAYDCYDFAVGYWNRTANEQGFYTFNSTAASPRRPFHEVQPLALNVVIEEDVWPEAGANIPESIGSTEAYYYLAGGNWVLFEGYGSGKGYVFASQWRDASATLYQYVLVEVDLATGAATVVPTPVYYGVAVSHEYSEGLLWNQTVIFTQIQFVQDDDSTPSHPKGQMFFWSNFDEDPDDSSEYRIWYKIIDWNPMGVSGNPKRTHLRERLLSAVNVVKGVPAQTDGVYESGAGGSSIYHWIYHPGSNLMFFVSNEPMGLTLDADEQKLLYMAPTAAFDHITNPYSTTRVASGKTVVWVSEARGDLGEPIASQTVEWAIDNESTVDEVLPVTPTPGETVDLDNTVNPTDAAISPIVVKKYGVPMTEGTGAGEVEFLRGSSQIKFYSPEPDSAAPAYTCTYRHWGTPGGDPHGNLLNTVSSSDADGKAYARVRYDEEDPVADRWDRISASDV